MDIDPMYVVTVTVTAALVAVAVTVAVIVWLMRHGQRPAAAVNRRLDDVRRSVERVHVPRVAALVRPGRPRWARHDARAGLPRGLSRAGGAALAEAVRGWGRRTATRLRSGMVAPWAAHAGGRRRAPNAHPVAAVGALGAGAAVSFALLYVGTEAAPGSDGPASPAAATVPQADPDPLVPAPRDEPEEAVSETPRLSAATGTVSGSSVPDASEAPAGDGDAASAETGGDTTRPDPAPPTPDAPPSGDGTGTDPGSGEGSEFAPPAAEPQPEPSEPAEPPEGPEGPEGPGEPSPPGSETPEEPGPPEGPGSPDEESSEGAGPSQGTEPSESSGPSQGAGPAPSNRPSDAVSPSGEASGF